ncbi:MAG TPA: ROK family protein [Candidatus Sulfotelmatobacter sp.]|jgi:glucokinase|nr:ROK family protein [Candidatus Sulfotelmatobacter sp.]
MTAASTTNGTVLGVDIGGTKVAVGLVNRDGKILAQGRQPMIATGTAEAALHAVTAAIDSLISSAAGDSVHSIGICAPGPLDPKAGIVLNPPNLPCWRNYPLSEEIASKYRVPVKVDNDANAAALAETRWGAARGFHYVFYATIGTGIGTGIVLDGRIYHGNTGSAGEGGHMSIDYRGPFCGCGKPGCIEVLAAGPAIGARARAKLSADPSPHSTILDFANGNISAVTSELVGQAYAAGDPLAHEVLLETVHLLTTWLGNIVDLLDPDVLVFGGGVAAMLKPFFDEIKSRLPSCCVNPHASNIPLLMAHYGADAGIAGGAALCSDNRP